MSEENVGVARQIADAFQQDDFAAALEATRDLLDPAVEIDTTRSAIPGLARVSRGVAEVGRFWIDWLEAWENFGSMEDPELIDAGDQVVAWQTEQRLRGKGSGIEIQMPEYAWVLTIRDRKLVRAILYLDKAEALEAAGLSE